MESTTLTRLTLELEPGAEPIQGRVGEEHGPSREFVGWLGLAAALGKAIRPVEARDGEPEEER